MIRRWLPIGIMISMMLGIPVLSTFVFTQVSVPTSLSARAKSTYRPGDCVRHPIIEVAALERWEEPTPFKTLYMVAEVGEQKYRIREWGGRSGPFNEWYPGYAESLPFTTLDNPREWQPVPCPEHVASAREVEDELLGYSYVITGPGGGTVLFHDNVVVPQ